MTQNVQDLIDKIKKEGIDQAQDQSRAIEAKAKQQAQQIVAQAQKDAAQMLAVAQDEIRKREAALRVGLQQASRDMLLSLRQEIQQVLRALIAGEVKAALTTEQLAAMLTQISRNEKGDLTIRLRPEDQARLQQGLLAKLQEEFKKGVVLEDREDIRAGFAVSFDAGKTFFDFTDTALVEYLSTLVNQELAAILRESKG